MSTIEAGRQPDCLDIPLPIVVLNRGTLVVGIVAGLALQQPLLTTLSSCTAITSAASSSERL